MALMECPECGKEISDTAKNCPNCGYDIQKYLKNIESQKSKHVQHQIRKIIIAVIIIVIPVIVLMIFIKTMRKEVVHGTNWGMSPSQVEKQEKKYCGTDGTYNSNDNYYAVSNTEFYGANVTMMYIFEDDKLSSVWIQPNDTSYENVYTMAVNICEKEGLPINFEDNTEDFIPNSRLSWNIKGSTIELIGNYEYHIPSYYFSIKPYDGHDYGEKYVPNKTCIYGSKTSFPCKNYVVPWNDNLDIWNEPQDLCYEHGCYVIGCPNGFANVSDKEPLCLIHHFLCE